MAASHTFPLHLPEIPSTPLLSVLMPSYNYERYVREAIESVLLQSYRHIELIVCDDGSTDSSRDIIRQIAEEDTRVRLIEQANAGVATALNTAYRASTGDLICLLDADDLFYPEKLVTVVHTFGAKPQAGFILHGMHVVDESGNLLYPLPRSGQYEEGWLDEAVRRRGGRWRSMPASALAFRREVADLMFPLPVEPLKSMADAYLYMLAPLLTEVAYVNKSLSGYRLHGKNLTGSTVFNLQTAEKFVGGMKQVHASIEEKACPYLFDTMPLDLDAHLTYREQAYLQHLFSGASPWKLLKECIRLTRAIYADDLYAPSRKTLGIVANSLAMVVPVRLRPSWMTWMLSAKWRSLFGQ